MYDYLIVGTGFFGATFAWHAIQASKSVLIIDSRSHIGGNCYTYDEGGIQVHAYGPHIFHTSSDRIWEFVNKFARFNSYTHRVKTTNGNKIYSLPFNMMTLHQIFGVMTEFDAIAALEQDREHMSRSNNLEEWAISLIGHKLYEEIVKGYTTKQWGRDPKNLPVSIISRLPVRFTWDDNYFDDTYQGIPVGGYTQIFDKLLSGCTIKLQTDFFKDREHLESLSKKTVYTGMIDEFYDRTFGQLEYRTLDFETEVINTSNYQGLSQMNYSSIDVPYTRIIEHKHFERNITKHTVITKEFPREWKLGDIPCYPINDIKNNTLYNQYHMLSQLEKRTLFGGRLASYKYRDMHQVIAEAMLLARKEGLIT